ncbi:hypothetical protein [Candidatus Mycoplasma haematominutum]|uniref:Uncharacterized protein n=1 Tax=Candidatus Mycoplasma haematominutum 'Birmingham 1' TaxID=1116213 RepID=G8C2R1_9MOLU|nr:hypothetical protein [Candidatus Mycoplasma haematominutum]CCE66609.1 hypothetical protein MHM_00910 [Candidatus Mycoplasma haematominutum 'Birmingham 1']
MEGANSANFCGYLKIENNVVKYKLKVVFEAGEWKVTIVKAEGERVSYYNRSAAKWIDKAAEAFKFEELTTFKSSNQMPWEDLSEISISKREVKNR